VSISSLCRIIGGLLPDYRPRRRLLPGRPRGCDPVSGFAARTRDRLLPRIRVTPLCGVAMKTASVFHEML